MVKLGQRGKDVITGFEGLVLGKAQYLTGCNQVLLMPQSLGPDGKRREGEWFDEQRVVAVGEEIMVLSVVPPSITPAATRSSRRGR